MSRAGSRLRARLACAVAACAIAAIGGSATDARPRHGDGGDDPARTPDPALFGSPAAPIVLPLLSPPTGTSLEPGGSPAPESVASLPPGPLPLIVAPFGFRSVPVPRVRAPGARFVVRQKWVASFGRNDDVVLLGSTTSDGERPSDDDVMPYVPALLAGLRGSSNAFTLLESRPETLCYGHPGYLVRYADRGSAPLAASVVFAVSGATAYTAIYEHDLATSDRPEAIASIRSLCPSDKAR